MEKQGLGRGLEMVVSDNIIKRLLDFGNSSVQEQFTLPEAEISQLCLASREIFLAQPNLLELQGHLKILVAARWEMRGRGASYALGPDTLPKFLKKHDVELICRGHQVVEDGYEFFADRLLVTIFPAPNFCGEGDNFGAMMNVEENLTCSFQDLKPLIKRLIHLRMKR